MVFAGSHVDGVMVSVAMKEIHYHEGEAVVIVFVPREWWIPDLSGDLQSAIAAAVSAIERSVEEPSENSITSGSVSSLEEYIEDWPSYLVGINYEDEDFLVYAEPWSVTCENLDNHDGMDLDDPVEVQLAVKTCLRESQR